MQDRTGSTKTGVILIGGGLFALLVFWLGWNGASGPFVAIYQALETPFGSLLVIGGAILFICGVAVSFASAQPGQKPFLALRICGGFMAALGLGLLGLALWGTQLAAEQQQTIGGGSALVSFIMGVIPVAIGIGLMRLNTVAVWGAIPYSAILFWNYTQQTANVLTYVMWLFLGITVYLSVAFLIQRRAVKGS